MRVDLLKEELIRDEGCIYEIYLDSEGLKTLGIGHLIKEADIEHKFSVGTQVDARTVNFYFKEDVDIALSDCEKMFPNFYDLPEEVKRVIANMMFNLGYNRLYKFKKFRKAISEENWMTAADEMIDSKWYKQVKSRSKRLVKRMRNVI